MRICVFVGMVNLTVDNKKKSSRQVKKRAKRKQKSRLGTRTKVENVDNLLINKTDRKTINIIFLSALFYPHIKNLNFVTFHNRQMWGVNSNQMFHRQQRHIMFLLHNDNFFYII